MKRIFNAAAGVAAIAAALPTLAFAQASGGEWTTSAGDAQRSAWIRSDSRLTREAVDAGDSSFSGKRSWTTSRSTASR